MSLPFFTGETLLAKFRVTPPEPWPTLEGTVRPATPAEARAFYAKLAAVRPDDTATEVKVRSEFYATHLKTWNATTADGAAVPITPELIARLGPVFDRLAEVCTGHAGLLGN